MTGLTTLSLTEYSDGCTTTSTCLHYLQLEGRKLGCSALLGSKPANMFWSLDMLVDEASTHYLCTRELGNQVSYCIEKPTCAAAAACS